MSLLPQPCAELGLGLSKPLVGFLLLQTNIPNPCEQGWQPSSLEEAGHCPHLSCHSLPCCPFLSIRRCRGAAPRLLRSSGVCEEPWGVRAVPSLCAVRGWGRGTPVCVSPPGEQQQGWQGRVPWNVPGCRGLPAPQESAQAVARRPGRRLRSAPPGAGSCWCCARNLV